MAVKHKIIPVNIAPSGPSSATIMIVGECPTQQDLFNNTPFSGGAGTELISMLTEARIFHNQCYTTYLYKSTLPKNDITSLIAEKKKDITSNHVPFRDKMVLPQYVSAVEFLKREIEMVKPNLIIALGDGVLFALCGVWGVTNWRGSLMQTDLPLSLSYSPKVIPTFPPWRILRQWHWRHIMVHDLRRCKKEAETNVFIPPNYSFIIRPNLGQVSAILITLQKEVAKGILDIAVDIETRAGHIACIGLAWSKTEAVCIPFMCTEDLSGYWSCEEELTIVFALYKLLTHPNCQVIGQYFSYDSQYINRFWLFQPNLFQDTATSHHSCFSNLPKSLGFISSLYCENHVYWKDEGKEWTKDMDEEQLWSYNCKDCCATFEAGLKLREVTNKMGMAEVDLFQQSLFSPVLETMNFGIRIDASRRGEFAMTLLDELAEREKFFYDVLGYELNPKSNIQMQNLFYYELGQKKVYQRKTGGVSCDDESLRKIADREPILLPLVKKIAEYRSLGVFLSTFVRAPLDVDGKMRCTFDVNGTETYRFSSKKNAFKSGMNMQNIPSGGSDGEEDSLELPNIRELFLPDPGYSFFDIDLDSADLRIVCWEADENEMKAMINEGKKVYVEVAREFYKDPTITKHSAVYGTFKALCHGTNYLGTDKGLAGRLGLTVHEVAKIQKWYFGKFPNIQKWQTELKHQVVSKRMVKNIFGYRNYFFGRIEGTIFNEAVAWIPQSTVACVINRGYRNIFDNLKEVQVLLQVHDSLAGQYKTTDHDRLIPRIIEECSIPLPFTDPLTIPVGIKTSSISWGACK